MAKQLLMIINEDRFFLSHRTRLASYAAENGWDVTLVTKDTGKRDVIEKMGFKYIELPINPTGMNPVQEIKTMWFLYRLFLRHPKAVIHLVGLKNMLWGGVASRLTPTRGVLYAVSGLGTLFGERSNGMVSRAIQHFLRFGMHKHNVAAIFQNHDDLDLFVDNKIVKEDTLHFIKGSGVNLNEYNPQCDGKTGPLIVIFTARMLIEKGVEDLVEAAELLRNEYEGKVEFWLCGGLSNNPNALTQSDMERLTDGKYIKWLGHREDICELLKKASIMCFPSYYREGVPKSLIEASASGLPLVTTDSVGCRDTVENGRNGFLVSPHSPLQIKDALKKLIDNPELRKSMGAESRRIAERDYDVNKVADIHLKIYETLNLCR